jgi:hypothetical protein
MLDCTASTENTTSSCFALAHRRTTSAISVGIGSEFLRQWAPRAQGQAMKGGRFFPEENL